MKRDYCVRCGSENIKTVKKKMEFKLPNPGTLKVEQECRECQECSDTYLTKSQIKDLSKKIKI